MVLFCGEDKGSLDVLGLRIGYEKVVRFGAAWMILLGGVFGPAQRAPGG